MIFLHYWSNLFSLDFIMLWIRSLFPCLFLQSQPFIFQSTYFLKIGVLFCYIFFFQWCIVVGSKLSCSAIHVFPDFLAGLKFSFCYQSVFLHHYLVVWYFVSYWESVPKAYHHTVLLFNGRVEEYKLSSMCFKVWEENPVNSKASRFMWWLGFGLRKTPEQPDWCEESISCV